MGTSSARPPRLATAQDVARALVSQSLLAQGCQLDIGTVAVLKLQNATLGADTAKVDGVFAFLFAVHRLISVTRAAKEG
jgi:hypothetical protein